ncbi:MAG: hypothetical protein ACTHJR_14905, partial [Sphingomonas sp.]
MLGKGKTVSLGRISPKMAVFRHFSELARPLQYCWHRRIGRHEIQGVTKMQSVSNGLGRTLVVVASTFACGSALMLAALGPGIAQANTAPQQVPVTQ